MENESRDNFGIENDLQKKMRNMEEYIRLLRIENKQLKDDMKRLNSAVMHREAQLAFMSDLISQLNININMEEI